MGRNGAGTFSSFDNLFGHTLTYMVSGRRRRGEEGGFLILVFVFIDRILFVSRLSCVCGNSSVSILL